MGCDIHPYAERREGDRWVLVKDAKTWEPDEFGTFRCYGIFAWLAGVRNYSAVEPAFPHRGVPEDASPEVVRLWDEGQDYYHSPSYVTLDELDAVDYDEEIEDRRCTREIRTNYWDGAQTCEPGEGKRMTLGEFLGPWFLSETKRLRDLGVERIVFWFDN